MEIDYPSVLPPYYHGMLVKAIWPPKRFGQVFYIVILYGRYFKLAALVRAEEHPFLWSFMVTSVRHEQVLPAHLCRVVWQQAEVANSKLKVKIDELSLFYH
jgi:hypothetical protein